jgi:hypothetical protein
VIFKISIAPTAKVIPLRCLRSGCVTPTLWLCQAKLCDFSVELARCKATLRQEFACASRAVCGKNSDSKA